MPGVHMSFKFPLRISIMIKCLILGFRFFVNGVSNPLYSFSLCHCPWQLDTLPMEMETLETAVASTAESELKTPSPNPPKLPSEITPDKARTYFDVYTWILQIYIYI